MLDSQVGDIDELNLTEIKLDNTKKYWIPFI